MVVDFDQLAEIDLSKRLQRVVREAPAGLLQLAFQTRARLSIGFHLPLPCLNGLP